MRWSSENHGATPVLLVAFLCALSPLLFCSATGRAAVPAQNPDFFGMNAQYVFKLPQQQWNRHLAAIANLGAGVIREDALWSWVEKRSPSGGRHSYNWSIPDAIATSLAENGLRWYPILDYSTPWGSTLGGPEGWKSAPSSPAYFAEYAQAFASRYGDGGEFWSTHPHLSNLPVQTYEIWNEPNLADFWPDVKGAAIRYGEILADTAPAIRAADPTARVAVGGLSPVGLTEFLDEIEARDPGLIGQMDAVAFHPYGGNFTGTSVRVRLLREWLNEHGAVAMPIEITETGWATPPLDEGQRAARMGTLVEGLADSSCGVSRIIPYTWLTFESSSSPEEWFGIANPDTSLKPTGAALASSIEAVVDGSPSPVADPCAGLEGIAGPVQSPLPAPPPEEADGAVSGPPLSPDSPLADPMPGAIAGSSPPSVETLARPAEAEALSAAVGVRLSRGSRTVTVRVGCAPACRSFVSLTSDGDRRAQSRASGGLLSSYRVRLALHAAAGRTMTVRVTARTPGLRPRTVVRKLR